MIKFWQKVHSILTKGEKVFLALVAENTKGSPGTPGAKLLISESDEQFGTIGGGIMEYNLTEKAIMAFKKSIFKSEILQLNHKRSGDGERSGMICSGTQTNLYIVCYPENILPEIEQILQCLHDDRAGLLKIDPTQFSVIKQAFNPDQPKVSLVQNQEKWQYLEQLLNEKRVAILGGGHCARALYQTMKTLGYEVFIFDTRENIRTLENKDYACEIKIVGDYQRVGTMIQYPELTNVVVMTHDYPSDVRGLLGVIDLPVPYIGVMGTSVKIANIYRGLQEHGIQRQRLETIHAPIGLSIESDTPEEIAISIAAQIIQIKNTV